MIKVCITGIIGSGKSTVLDYIGKLGGFTLSADSVNAELLKDSEYVAKLGKIFPDAVGDTVDKAKIRATILKDENKRIALNELSHSAIMDKMFEKANGHDVVFFEVPLLDKQYESEFDRIVQVVVPDEVAEERIMARDVRTREEAKAFIELQKRGITYTPTDIIHSVGEEWCREAENLYHEIVK